MFHIVPMTYSVRKFKSNECPVSIIILLCHFQCLMTKRDQLPHKFSVIEPKKVKFYFLLCVQNEHTEQAKKKNRQRLTIYYIKTFLLYIWAAFSSTSYRVSSYFFFVWFYYTLCETTHRSLYRMILVACEKKQKT